jgi:excisionase family DNA binding protein
MRVSMPALRKPAHPYLSDDALLDAREVAGLLHMPLSTVLEFARRGVVPGHKLGRRWIFLRDELEASVRAAPSHPETVVRVTPRARETVARAPSRPGRISSRAGASRPSPAQPKLFGSDLG